MLPNRAAAILGDTLVLAIAIVITASAWLADSPEAYTFPRLITGLFLLFAIANLIRDAFFAAASVHGINTKLIKKIAPGGTIIATYIAVADIAGFYLSSCITYATLSFVYEKTHNKRTLAKNLAVAVTATILLYLVFALILKVQTPRGLLI